MSKICSDCRFSIQDFPDLFCTVRKLSTKDGLFVTCHHYLPKTVFHRITASPEVLAEKLVYSFACYDRMGVYWRSTIVKDDVDWSTKEEAIAATLAKLKEVME